MYILTVEDDIAIRESIREILESVGYLVETACNGQEALDVLHCKTKPSLILLDLMMPVMNGWQFIDEVIKDESLSTVPIIIISAVTFQGVLGDKPNIIKVIKKPVSIEQLLRVVKEVCGNPIKQNRVEP